MIIYRVNITLDADIENDWKKWMTDTHIPDVMATKCFENVDMFKSVTTDKATYCIEYQCIDLETYQHYQDTYAKDLQKDHTTRYLNKFTAYRTILKIIE